MKSHWDKRFSEEDFLYGEDANQFIQQIIPVIKPEGKILAIAEGEGRNAFFIAKESHNHQRDVVIDLWDYSSVALEKVEARKGALPINTHEVDLTEASWQESEYDAAFCVFGHFDGPMQKSVWEGLRKTVKPGGWIFGEVYSTSQIPYESGGPRNLDYLYHPSFFLDIFKDDFLKHFYVGEVMREEGPLHRGISHVIQFAIQIQK